MPVPALVFLRLLVILGFRVWGITWIPKKKQNHCPKPLKTGGATILHILGGSGTTDKIVVPLGLFVLGFFFKKKSLQRTLHLSSSSVFLLSLLVPSLV